MYYVDPHIHMSSRTTDDYVRLAQSGCVAVTEPAFWPGWDRCSVDGFRDYFHQLTEFEPARAAKFGIQHFTWLCVNAKEAENVSLSREVIDVIPELFDGKNVLGVGEIGLNKNTRNEAAIFLEQVDLAARHDQLILIHTPHLDDKYQGTRMIIDMLNSDSRIEPSRVMIDHAEEHTIGLILSAGFWAGMTLYPTTKTTPARAVDMIERFGAERVWVNSSADWGPSNPMAVADFMFQMRRRGHNEDFLRHVVYENPATFLSQSRNFHFNPPEIDAAVGR